jgi:hypothetical protein
MKNLATQEQTRGTAPEPLPLKPTLKSVEDVMYNEWNDQPSSPTGVSVEHQFDDTDTVMRNQIQSRLLGNGSRLLSIKTPREILMIIYDALEGELEP